VKPLGQIFIGQMDGTRKCYGPLTAPVVQATGGNIRLSNSDINFNTVNGLTGSPTNYGNNRIFGNTGTTMCGVQPGRTVIPGSKPGICTNYGAVELAEFELRFR
jgi:hypothetical protein